MNDRALIGGAALVFVTSAVVTVWWCGAMSGMPGMDMPGGWTMSMAWMRMPEQSWLDAAAMFIGMWTVMMVAMMTPALVPMLARYRAVKRRGTALVASGYFTVWTAVGLLTYPLGVALAEWTMRDPAISRLVPVATALVVLVAGVVQFTPWKARQLACCGRACARRVGSRSPWSHGMDLGLRCVRCCAGLTAALLVLGVMDLAAMALVTLAISAERLLPGMRAARAAGVGLILAGAGLMLALP